MVAEVFLILPCAQILTNLQNIQTSKLVQSTRSPHSCDPFDDAQLVHEEPSPPIPSGTRITVYWTEMDQWFDGTVTSSRLETGDDGQRQRATHVQYDPVGVWRSSRQLSYWHCLDDEHWQLADNGAA